MEKDEKPEGCCRDELKWVKLQDDQKVSVSLILPFQPQASRPISYPDIISLLNLAQTSTFFSNDHAPPLNHGKVLYKYYCVFLI
jgi:hypothetical protein